MPKRKPISIQFKVEIIKEYEKNALQSKKALAARFNLPESTLKGILKNKDAIINASKDVDSKRSRIQCGRYEKLESALITWFNEMRASNLPIDSVILKEKARTLAEKYEIENFTASWGWLEKLKKRHGLSHRRITGESACVDDNDVEKWLQNLPTLIKDYKPKDIFNCDETGLFFKMMPDKTLSYKGDPCHGGRKSKERLTILFCTNSDGSEKIEPLVIGKSKKPRCFKNTKKLPCSYRNSQKAWMTSQIFIDFLKEMDNKFRKQQRKILLLMDHCPSHPPVKDLPVLQQINVQFLPANSTSRLQPLDLGIIQNFKVNYRRSLIRRFIIDRENKTETKAISILDAMHLTASAWKNVTSQTIMNCFRKCGFTQDQTASSINETNFESVWGSFDDEDWDEMFMDEGAFKDYVECDENVLVSELRTAEEIFQDINNEDVSEEDDEDDNINPTVVTFSEASAALNTLKNYIHQNDYSQNSLKALSDLEKDVFSFRRLQKQTNITSFFEKIPSVNTT